MKQAVMDRRIEHDPTAGIPYPRIPRHEPVTLDAQQARHLMDLVAGERFSPILVLSLGLGLRRGEALGLRTSDIEWSDDEPDEGALSALDGRGRLVRGARSEMAMGVGRGEMRGVLAAGQRVHGRPVALTIRHALRYISPSMRAEGEGPYRLTGTKTGESRSVPLPEFVAEALAARLEERDAERRAAKVWAPNDFVFCDARGNSVPLESLRTWYLGALKRAGLPAIRWHSLRATTITLLIEAGVDLITIQRIAGHRNLETTRLYVGKTPAALASAAAKLDEVIG